MSFIEDVKAKAKAKQKTIVLPESEDKRVLQAAEQIQKEGFSRLILLGEKEQVEKDAKAWGVDLSGIEIVNPKTYAKLDEYVSTLVVKGDDGRRGKKAADRKQHLFWCYDG